jgi:uncharacterized caspase-like protein
MGHFHRIAVALIVVHVHFALAIPCHADVRALVVGIDDYQHEPKLEGAVSDAEDIAAALRKLGAASVTVLLNQEATRTRLEQIWGKTVVAAKPGDTLVFAFAGHGSQETHHRTNRRANAFLLADFDRKSMTGFRERITNEEIKHWFRSVGEGVRIIFVADSCHSGSMMRTVDGRVVRSERAVAPYGLPDWVDVPAEDKGSDEELKHVTFLAATEEDKKIQAVPIEGKLRGALSYAFARALERAAAEDGKLRRLHLESHVRPIVRQLSEGRQIPKLLPPVGEPGDVLLEGSHAPGAPPPSTNGGPLRIKVLNLDAASISKLMNSLTDVTLVGGAESPDLIWDARDGSVLTGQGDIAAYDVSAGQLQAVVDKWRVVTELKRLAIGRPLGMSLQPNDARQPSGRRIAFLSEPPGLAYLTTFNLAADGTIEFLYPQPERRDPREWPSNNPYRLNLMVTSPFGAEHLVVVASARPLDAFHQRLRRSRVADVPKLLTEALAGIEHAIGIQGLYTFDVRMGR